MFGAEDTRGVDLPGTLYPWPDADFQILSQMQISMRVGGQKILIAPTHPRDPMAPAPPFPYCGSGVRWLTVTDLDAATSELPARGADVAIGPLARDAGACLAFARARTASRWNWC